MELNRVNTGTPASVLSLYVMIKIMSHLSRISLCYIIVKYSVLFIRSISQPTQTVVKYLDIMYT
jgi:hypothetical protein